MILLCFVLYVTEVKNCLHAMIANTRLHTTVVVNTWQADIKSTTENQKKI